MQITRRTAIAGAATLPAAVAAGFWATAHPAKCRGSSDVSITTAGEKRLVIANGLPAHVVGNFPNPHNPSPVRPQNHRFEVPLTPKAAEKPLAVGMSLFGVAVNGVPFNTAGPFWNADRESGWQFEVLHPANAVALGIDVNHAHTQGRRGMYHYHGIPTGLLWDLVVAAPDRPMLLLGYAADGFPIYGPECPSNPSDLKSHPRRLRSSYRLRCGKRKDGPKGRYDGTFVEDFEYEPKRSELDECNGRTGPTPEYPNGTYYYVLTDEFPFIPRMYKGTPDPSFRHGPPPGHSPPLPPELMRNEGKA